MNRIFKICFQFPDEIENGEIRYAEVTVSTKLLLFPCNAISLNTG